MTTASPQRATAAPAAAPIPVQVVFQGGGAKLCVLMAVCAVLKDYQSRGLIQINRVAGSSAGAIAAVMLASDRDIETYKAELRAIAPSYLSGMRVWKLAGGLRVLWGGRYFSGFDLESFFEELFPQPSVPGKLNELAIESELYYTDLYTLESKKSPPEEAVTKALARSCRFPLAFVGHSSGNVEVDGGLAANLPVDRLKQEESTHGTVIGVSFTSGFGSKNKSNLGGYVQQLFSAAIQSGVNRSELILGQRNVFRITTDIGTFDFNEALAELKEGSNARYNLAALEFKAKFDSWLGQWPTTTPVANPATPTDTDKPASPTRLIRPSLSRTPLAPAIVRDIDDRLKSDPCTRAKLVSVFETAILDDKGAFTGRYKSKNKMIFNVTRRTNILQFNFQVGKNGEFTDMKLGCGASDRNGKSLRFTPDVQEITQQGEELRTFRVYFLFDGQLTPDDLNQPYYVDYEYIGMDSYPNLGTKPEFSTLTPWQGDAGEMVFAVAFPRSKLRQNPVQTDIATLAPDQLRAIGYQLDQGEHLVASELMDNVEFLGDLALDYPPERYYLAGRRARAVKQGSSIGFVLE